MFTPFFQIAVEDIIPRVGYTILVFSQLTIIYPQGIPLRS